VSSDTYNLTATANKVNIIEVDASSLDVDNGFDCVRVGIATPGQRRPDRRPVHPDRRPLPASDHPGRDFGLG
jgi:hypothetical protein